MDKQYFLATTALEEFWDPQKPLLFLGEWCLKFDRRPYWRSLHGHQVESYIHGMKEANKIYSESDNIYETILPIVADTLNRLHQTEFSLRYWRIVIGPWLRVYLTSVYDRFQRITLILEKYPNLTTILLADVSFADLQDTEHFANEIRTDVYNLQIYSKIFLFLGKKFPRKVITGGQSNKACGAHARSWKQAIFSAVTDLYRLLVIKLVSKPVVINNSYLPKKVEFKLAVNLFGRLFTTTGMTTNKTYYQCDSGLRKKLMEVSLGESAFCRCLSSMLFADMPTCFVEGYRSIVEIGEASYPRSAQIIFSANAWWYDEVFKFWAAANAEKGIILLGTPHGGNYSALLNHPIRKHEEDIVDYYYRWGPNGGKIQPKLIAMPLIKLTGLKNMGADNLKSDILWVTIGLSRYVRGDAPFAAPEFYKQYLMWQERFSKTLSFLASSSMCVRAHPLDLGWGVVSRLKAQNPKVKLDPSKAQFLESLDNCRLFVCDHLSTTYAEALACNKPTILFWSPDNNPLMFDAEQYFELLRNVGVLFDSPEAAAEAVNHVYEDVETWWNDPKRQKAVRLFRKMFLGQSDYAENLWLEEFCRIAS